MFDWIGKHSTTIMWIIGLLFTSGCSSMATYYRTRFDKKKDARVDVFKKDLTDYLGEPKARLSLADESDIDHYIKRNPPCSDTKTIINSVRDKPSLGMFLDLWIERICSIRKEIGQAPITKIKLVELLLAEDPGMASLKKKPTDPFGRPTGQSILDQEHDFHLYRNADNNAYGKLHGITKVEFDEMHAHYRLYFTCSDHLEFIKAEGALNKKVSSFVHHLASKQIKFFSKANFETMAVDLGWDLRTVEYAVYRSLSSDRGSGWVDMDKDNEQFIFRYEDFMNFQKKHYTDFDFPSVQ